MSSCICCWIRATAIVSILPVMVTAWLFGLRVGLLAAMMAVLLNTLLVTLVSDRSWQEFREGGALGSAALVAVGAVTGSLHDLAEKARDELNQRRLTEEALQEAYDELEIRVAERTAKLSTTKATLAYETVQRQQAEDIQQQLATALNNSIDGIALVDYKGQFVHVNDALLRMHGYARLEALPGNTWMVLYGEEERERFDQQIMPKFSGEGKGRGEVVGRRADGSTILKEVSMNAMEGGGLVCIERDVSARKRLEEQLLQARKMEAVGQLAGGVAHDFNNLLTAILGYSQLGVTQVSPAEKLSEYLEEIQKAAERAAHLTQQLLTFSRPQIVEPRSLSLNDLILNMDRILRRLVGEDIELVTPLASNLRPVNADQGQMEQLLVNLAVNARDAMPNGGKLIIETGNVSFEEEEPEQHLDTSPGDYAMLAVSDTGAGMPTEVKSHIFEPFFTTKEVGKGTGLGLSTCYAIVAQCGGRITVDSEPGQGTTFRIYLPTAERVADPSPYRSEPGSLPWGVETVLLVEAEPLVRRLAAQVLRDQSYTVLEATNGQKALRLAEDRGSEKIDLLLADAVMPLNGDRKLTEELKEAHPETRVLYTSGYMDDMVISEGVLELGADILLKPFTPMALAHKVRQVLDRLRVGAQCFHCEPYRNRGPKVRSIPIEESRMEVTGPQALRRILGVFAHPDDETTAAGGTFTRYAREGVEIHVAIATRGEQGTLGTGGVTFKREELPAIREAEARSALNMLGAQPLIFLDYRDGELARVDYQRLVERVEAVME